MPERDAVSKEVSESLNRSAKGVYLVSFGALALGAFETNTAAVLCNGSFVRPAACVMLARVSANHTCERARSLASNKRVPVDTNDDTYFEGQRPQIEWQKSVFRKVESFLA